MKRKVVRLSGRAWRGVLLAKRAIPHVRVLAIPNDWADWRARQAAIHILHHVPRSEGPCKTCPVEAREILNFRLTGE